MINQNELMYAAVFVTLKKLYDKGEISKDVFDRLNKINAENQGCKSIRI